MTDRPVPDPVDLRVAARVYREIVWAYGYVPPGERDGRVEEETADES